MSRPFLALLAVLAADAGHAATDVFGGGQFSSAHRTRSSDLYDPGAAGPRRQWMAKLAGGIGMSQLVSAERPGARSQVMDSNMQLNLAALLERSIAGPFSMESGLVLGMQFARVGPAQSTAFSARYLTIPAVARLAFTRNLSLGAGGFATIPIDDLDGAPAVRRLTTTNVGILATARWTVPASRLVAWLLEVSAERGMVHIGEAGAAPNHVRSLNALVGMTASF